VRHISQDQGTPRQRFGKIVGEDEPVVKGG
jgi:hypothetical protein